MTQQRISLHDLRGMRRAACKRLNRADMACDAAEKSRDMNAYDAAYARYTRARDAYYRVADELCARLGVEVYP